MPAFFLDYDGTLTPIVDNPFEARLACYTLHPSHPSRPPHPSHTAHSAHSTHTSTPEHPGASCHPRPTLMLATECSLLSDSTDPFGTVKY